MDATSTSPYLSLCGLLASMSNFKYLRGGKILKTRVHIDFIYSIPAIRFADFN